MKTHSPNWLTDDSGTTLLENMLAMVLLSVIILGGFQFFIGGNQVIYSNTIRRLAIIEVEKHLETVFLYDYNSLETSLNETDTPIDLGHFTGLRTTVVTAIDDPIDGQATADADDNPDDYKKIVSTIKWSDKNTHQVSLSTYVAPDYRL